MEPVELACRQCSWRAFLGPFYRGCPLCGGTLLVAYSPEVALNSYRAYGSVPTLGVARTVMPGLDRYTTLGEGRTPLLIAEDLAAEHGFGSIYIKNEGVNPTGTYKDRMNSVAVSTALQFGLDRVVTTSTGNQAVSLAAYAAAAGLRADVLLAPESPERAGKEVARLGGHAWVTSWSGRAKVAQKLVDNHKYAYVGRNCPRPLANPYGLEGYKTIAYEIVAELGGKSPDCVLMPSCGGDGIYGTWRGFCELKAAGVIAVLPRMVGCHLAAAPSVTAAWRERLTEVVAVVPEPSVALSLIDERGGDHALWALYESAGAAVPVGEDEIASAVTALGRLGILAEPAAAVGIAALGRCREELDAASASVGDVLAGPSWKGSAGDADVRHQPARALDAVVVVTGNGARWPETVAGVRSADLVVEGMAEGVFPLHAASRERLR